MDLIYSNETINNETFRFVKNGTEIVRLGHDVAEGFERKHRLFQNCLKRNQVNKQTDLISNAYDNLTSLLDETLCNDIVTKIKNSDLDHKAAIQTLLPLILNDHVDTEIRSYFNSEYAVAWYEFTEVESANDEPFYYTKWHCDGGPSKHLKIITYLNSSQEHGGNTFFYDKERTDALKNVGYIFCNTENRKKNLDNLLDYLGFETSPNFFTLNPGDGVIFNPLEVAHRCDVPKEGAKRYTVSICIVPSPIPWYEVNQNYWKPAYQCMPFENIAKSIDLLPVYTDKKIEDEVIYLSMEGKIDSINSLKYYLNNIFSDKSYINAMYQRIIEFDPNLNQVNNISKLVQLLKNSFKSSIPWEGVLNSFDTNNLLELSKFEEKAVNSLICYQTQGKPNPNAIFWPNPTNNKNPQSKFEQLPFVIKNPIMTKDTPIGSAGSCFAFEISKVLQEEGYNYVVSEKIESPNSEVIIDGYTPGDKIVKFSANYGIIFNSPSFTQLAEKAFNIRQPQKLLSQLPGGLFTDPYRENVFFKSVEAYENDYNKHINALKHTFMTAEVFVITLGLNECWMLNDGTALSRNPKSGMGYLIKHKTLTVKENVEYIQRFFDIIKEHNPKFKLVITLSPIPFLATGKGKTHHVIEANTHSKAVLRVAAEELVSNNEDMFYLPSYELVTECSENPWEADHRHVTKETVKRVIDMFKEMFVS